MTEGTVLTLGVSGRRAAHGRVPVAEARRATELVLLIQVEVPRLAPGYITYTQHITALITV